MIGMTAHQLLLTIHICIKQGKNHYTQESRQTFQQILATRFHKYIKTRCVGQTLKNLEDIGYIKRMTQYGRAENRQVRQLPSFFWITSKGRQHLIDHHVKVA